MNDLFLRAAQGLEVERTPVWIMRQAGRYMPEFREIRSRVDFLSLCKNPELATEVTLQPVNGIGVDAAILFADILLPLEAMGRELLFLPGKGPQFPDPVRDRAAIASLRTPDVDETLGYVFDALRLVRRELDGKLPVIGFGGTPWTLAAYVVEGGTSKHHNHLLGWSYRDPEGLAELLDRIAEVSAPYLSRQVDAGAQAIQIFDTWGGLLDAERWRSLALPSLLKSIEPLAGRVPVTYYLRGGAHLLEEIRELPVNVLSVDWRQPLSQVRSVVGPGKTLQGNLDPGVLLAPIPEIRRRTAEMLREASGGAHIANLGHGILPMTPVENARAFVEAVQELSASPAMAGS